jgi:hypothetical protein
METANFRLFAENGMENGHCSAHKTVKMFFFSQREDDEQTGISNFSSTVSM